MSQGLLYLITPATLPDPASFAAELAAVLGEGAGTNAEVACVQLRLKGAGDGEVLRAAELLMPLCERMGAGFLVNDRADLAAKAGADGVHLGQSDGDAASARKLLGPDKDIGVTCHGSIHLAMEAGEAGADYVAFGAFYPSATKDADHHAEREILTRWQAMATVPSVAIGGITPETSRGLIEAGADMLAVSGAIWQADGGPRAAMRAFVKALKG